MQDVRQTPSVLFPRATSSPLRGRPAQVLSQTAYSELQAGTQSASNRHHSCKERRMRAANAITKRPSVRQTKLAAGINEPHNAIQLLRADHREAEALFKTFKKSSSAMDKQSLAKKI